MLQNLVRSCARLPSRLLALNRGFCTFHPAAAKFGSHAPNPDRFTKPDVVAAIEKGEISLQDLQGLSLIDKKLKQSITKLNYDSLTPVQSRSLLPMLVEDGVVCRAKTGTGKTMAFAIPIVQACLDWYDPSGRPSKTHALVVAPTRDLAMQIKTEFDKLTKDKAIAKKVLVQLSVGGKAEARFRGAPSIIIATPGRLEANLRNPRYAEQFSDLKYQVYDEADRLLDQGFEDTLLNIEELLVAARDQYAEDPTIKTKNVLFSATVDDRMDSFAKKAIGENYTYINCVNADEPESHENIHQTIVKTRSAYESHVAAISDILRNKSEDKAYKAILFIPTVSGSNFLYDVISELSTSFLNTRSNWIYKLNGEMTQRKRDVVTQRFRSCLSGLLVCTDVAARGLDFKNVTDVIQISPSMQVADYVHKVGRTARAGTSGNATLYLSDGEFKYKRTLENERGIVFSKEVRYETFEEDNKKFEELELPAEEVEDYVKSAFGFYKAVVSTYRLHLETVLRDLIIVYRSFLADPTASLFLSDKMFQTLRVPFSLVPDYIRSNVKPRFPSGNGNKSRNGYRGNNNSNSNYRNDRLRNFDRNGGYSNDRYSSRQNFSDNKRFNRSSYSNDGFRGREERDGDNFKRLNDRKSKRSFDNSRSSNRY